MLRSSFYYFLEVEAQWKNTHNENSIPGAPFRLQIEKLNFHPELIRQMHCIWRSPNNAVKYMLIFKLILSHSWDLWHYTNEIISITWYNLRFNRPSGAVDPPSSKQYIKWRFHSCALCIHICIYIRRYVDVHKYMYRRCGVIYNSQLFSLTSRLGKALSGLFPNTPPYAVKSSMLSCKGRQIVLNLQARSLTLSPNSILNILHFDRKSPWF